MARLPRITATQVIGVLEKNGFALERQKGSHKIYRGIGGNRVTVPCHAGKIIRPKTLKSILRDAGWNVNEFVSLLRDS